MSPVQTNAERDYWRDLESTHLAKSGFWASIFVLVLLAGATLGDIYSIPSDQRVIYLPVRAWLCSWTLIHTITSHFTPHLYRRIHSWLMVGFLVQLGLGSSIISICAGGIDSLYFMAVVQAQFGFATFIPMRRGAMRIGLLGSAVAFILVTVVSGGDPQIPMLISVLGISTALAIYAHHQLLSVGVREYEKSHLLVAQNEELTQLRDKLEHQVEERTQQLQTAMEKLQHSEHTLRALSKSLVNTRETEGARISRELHDELGQLLTGLKIGLRVLPRKFGGDENVRLVDESDRLTGIVDAAIHSVKRITRELRPTMLDDIGLTATLTNLVDSYEERTMIPCELELSVNEEQLNGEQRTVIFRITQEALTNVARHASATLAQVKMHDDEHGVHVSVLDNGIGIHPHALQSVQSSGIAGMKERALSVGGTVEVQRRPTTGTEISLFVPTEPMS